MSEELIVLQPDTEKEEADREYSFKSWQTHKPRGWYTNAPMSKTSLLGGSGIGCKTPKRRTGTE